MQTAKRIAPVTATARNLQSHDTTGTRPSSNTTPKAVARKRRSENQKVRNKVPERGFLGSWLTLLDGLKIVESDAFTYDDETAFELAGVRSSLVKLRDFPFVRKREKAGLLALHG